MLSTSLSPETALALRRTAIETPPLTPDQLHGWLSCMLDLDIPRSARIDGHAAPFDYLCHAYFEDQRTHRNAIVWASRGSGKTLLGAVATLLDMLYKPGIEVCILGGSFAQSSRMHEHLCRLLHRDPLCHIVEGSITRTHVSLVNGSRVQVISQSQRAVRGLRAHRLRCDEVEHFTPEVWEAAQLITRSGRCGEIDVRAGIEALSTMHKPFGLMNTLVRSADRIDAQLFRWNVIDVLEHCEDDRQCDDCTLFSESEGGCHGLAKDRPSGDDTACIAQPMAELAPDGQVVDVCQNPDMLDEAMIDAGSAGTASLLGNGDAVAIEAPPGRNDLRESERFDRSLVSDVRPNPDMGDSTMFGAGSADSASALGHDHTHVIHPSPERIAVRAPQHDLRGLVPDVCQNPDMVASGQIGHRVDNPEGNARNAMRTTTINASCGRWEDVCQNPYVLDSAMDDAGLALEVEANAWIDDAPLHRHAHPLPRPRGFFHIDDAIDQRSRASDLAWQSEMLCSRPDVTDCVYREFDERRHVFDDRTSPRNDASIQWIGGIDFGYRAPTAVLLAMLDGGNTLHVMDEFIESGCRTQTVIDRVREKFARFGIGAGTGVGGRFRFFGVDPAGLQRSDQSGVSTVSLWRRAGFVMRTRATTIEAGIEAVRARLSGSSSGMGGVGGVGLRVHERCVKLIRALREYHYPGGPEMEEDLPPVKDGPDHACDALRYMIANLDGRSSAVTVRAY